MSQPSGARIHPSQAFVGPFSADGKYLAVRPTADSVAVVDVASKKIAATFDKAEATALAFTPDSRSLVAAVGQIRVYDISNAKEKPLSYFANGSYVHSLRYSRDGTLLAIGVWNNDVHVLDAVTFKPRSICKGHTDGVTTLAFDPEGRILVTGGYDKTVRMWETTTGRSLAILGEAEGYKGAIYGVAFSPDGKTFVTAGYDDIVRIWRIRE
jgi:WD40 repeat protein